MPLTNSIPASEIVSVQPSVLGAGGTALEMIGLVLSTSTRVPIGAVASFANDNDVAAYFGAGSHEASIAGVYFAGYTGGQQTPESIMFAQYNTAAVAAYLRGGNISALALSTLQTYSGTLAISVDGYARSGSVNLSSASSFSNAASLIQTALNASPPVVASATGSFGSSFTGTATGSSLAVTGVVGYLSVGDVVAGTGITSGTSIIAQVSGTPGGAGTYTLSASATSSGASLTATSAYVNISAVASGTIAIGQTVTGVSVPPGTVIIALGTGTGTTGTYLTNLAVASQISVASESLSLVGTNVAVTFDSVSGGFVITSGITGAPSEIAFPTTSAIATELLLTQATGAVISQGAAPASPLSFMNALIQVNQSWVTFMLGFDPDNGSGNAQKLLFAEWTSQQDDQFAFICWDTDITPTQTVPATGSLGYLIAQAQYSGTCLIYEPSDLYHAAFICGVAASVDYSQTNGRITFKFRNQAGLTPGVTNPTVAQNLAANGYNFYGAYASRTGNFTFFANGVVSGPFKWLDSYLNQIQLNNALQTAILVGLTNTNSLPYNQAGYALVEAFCLDPINAALNFGTIRANVPLSAEQIAEVNEAAGGNVATVIQNTGWYLQVQDASPTTRGNRTSPPCKLWYSDGGAIQEINLDSIEVQ